MLTLFKKDPIIVLNAVVERGQFIYFSNIMLFGQAESIMLKSSCPAII